MAVPVQIPLQLKSVPLLLTDNGNGSAIAMLVDAVHPFASVIVTPKVPAHKLMAILLVWVNGSSQE